MLLYISDTSPETKRPKMLHLSYFLYICTTRERRNAKESRQNKLTLFTTMLPENFVKNLIDALLHVLCSILKLILLPFNLWVKAITRLADQREKGFLNLSTITGLWPFFSFCKRLLIDFIFDAVAFLAYPVGVVVAIIIMIIGFTETNMFYTAGDVFLGFIISLIVIYIYPIFMALAHDFLVLMLLPIRKLIDYWRKPAQQLDIDYKQRE